MRLYVRRWERRYDTVGSKDPEGWCGVSIGYVCRWVLGVGRWALGELEYCSSGTRRVYATGRIV
jgi:hypothetical protein